MKRTMTALTITLASVSATATLAQDAAIDANADGMYSYPELQAVLPEMTEDEFTILDVSGDGLLDVDEIAAGTEAGLLPAYDG